MRDFVIVTDSCIDLPASLVAELGLVVLPLKVTVEGKEYQNFPDEREIKTKAFYDLLRAHKPTSTAQATPHDFVETWTPILQEGKDILSISFSSALSGTYNSSLIAANELKELFPDSRIECVDSLCASMGYGLLAFYAGKMKLEEAELDDVLDFVEAMKLRVSHLFTVSDLGHLRRGGRLSAGKELIGTILNVKPLLHVSEAGKLVVYDKARGRIKSLHSIVNRMVESYDKNYDQWVFISHGDNEEDAQFVKSLILEKLPVKENQIIINPIGPVIGSHSGVDTMALFYLGYDRVPEETE